MFMEVKVVVIRSELLAVARTLVPREVIVT
jgi:hypothetical protein